MSTVARRPLPRLASLEFSYPPATLPKRAPLLDGKPLPKLSVSLPSVKALLARFGIEPVLLSAWDRYCKGKPCKRSARTFLKMFKG
jgi:hypothetical protein